MENNLKTRTFAAEVIMTAQELNEIMCEQYSYISYDSSLAEEYLNCGAPKTGDKETIAWCFADYLLSQNLADEVVL